MARLQGTARRWPLSFVGDGPAAEPAAEAVVLAHPALRQAYIDRIIEARDLFRARQEPLIALVGAALGAHAATLWPDFAAFATPTFAPAV